MTYPYRLTLMLTILFIFSETEVSFAQSRIWTLQDCFEYTLQNNIQVKQSMLGVERTRIDLTQNKLNLLPSINSDVSYTYNWGRVLDRTSYIYINKETRQANFGVFANLRIFGGFQYQNQIRKASLDFLAAKYEHDKLKDDISLLLTRAYLNILYNKELLKVAEAQLKVTQEQIKRTQKMVEAGKLALGSLLEIQAQEAREELTVTNYQNSLALAYLDLMQIMDLPAGTDFDIEEPALNVDEVPTLLPLESIYEIALNTQPAIKSAETNVESAYRNIAIARGALIPSINLQSGIMTNYSNQFRNYTLDPGTGQLIPSEVKPFPDQFRDNQSQYLGLAISIPIFNGYQVSTNVSRARLAYQNAEYNLELARNNLRKSIEQAYHDAQSAYKTYLAAKKSVLSFNESFRYTEQRFNVGMATSVDYNLAKTQLAAAESELLRARYDYVFKAKILDFYMGKPITLD